MALYSCSKCGGLVSDTAAKCPACGNPIAEDTPQSSKCSDEKIKCPECGALITPVNGVCPECGFPISNVNNSQTSSDNVEYDADARSVSSRLTPKQGVEWTESYMGHLAQYVYECFAIMRNTMFGRTFKFSGRASRREYWSYMFFAPAMISLIGGFLAILYVGLNFFVCTVSKSYSSLEGVGIIVYVIGGIISVFILFSYISVSFRRMHDTGRSGLWFIIPVLSFFYALQESEPYHNYYGDEPDHCLEED